jgi:hypothetical protein
MNKEIIAATLNLFNGIVITKQDYDKASLSKYLICKTFRVCLKNGFILSPSIYLQYKKDIVEILSQIDDTVGINGKNLNTAFHKSWEKVCDSSIEQLVLEQFVHYFTTYGFESLGIDNDIVYIPTEKLKIPKVKIDRIPLTIIHGYTLDEIKSKISALLSSGIALSEKTIQDLVLLIKYYKFFNATDLANIKNKEIRVILYKELNIIPANNVEFLRFLIYISTGKSLLIKNKETIESIKSGSLDVDVFNCLNTYIKMYGIERLGEIFYRFKPLFLAFKFNDCQPIINRIRRSAKQNHKPLIPDYINSVTQLLVKDDLDLHKLFNELKKVNTFRKIKLLYALAMRTIDCGSAVYNIRNGKTWTKLVKNNYSYEQASEIYNIVYSNLVNDISPNIKGKKIYIPKNIKYSIPSTEKQFVDKIPAGTHIKFDNRMVFGVHWANQDGQRIDLDLSLLSLNKKFGWDAYYRSGSDILFSGDMTDAPQPHGASELFSISNTNDKQFLVSLNYYNRDNDSPKIVPFKLFLAKTFDKKMSHNYMVDPNNILTQCNLELSRQQKFIGFINRTGFYFTNSDFIQGRTLRDNNHTKNMINYFVKFYQNALSLNYLLHDAGAIMVDNPEDCDINLDLQSIEKDTIINLLTKP